MREKNHFVINDREVFTKNRTFKFSLLLVWSILVSVIYFNLVHAGQQILTKDLKKTNLLSGAIEITIGEVGQITTLTHTPQIVNLSYVYSQPVVFAQPLSFNGGDTSVVRVFNVQEDSFTLYIHEAPNKDGSHTTETVSYMVIETGEWELSNGTKLEVGKINTAATVGITSNQWKTNNFNSTFSSTPVVFTQVQTSNDPHWVKTRQRNTVMNSFQLAMEEDEAQIQARGAETIGWLAIESSQGLWSGHNYKVATTSNSVTQNWHIINFGGGVFSQSPRFIANIATYTGSDPSYLRYQNLLTDSVQVKIEEDTTLDSEINHATEVVNYLAIQGNGLLSAQDGGNYIIGGYQVYLPLVGDYPPEYTSSYYMDTVNPATLYDLGCTQGIKDYNLTGDQRNAAILDFGKPWYVNGQYGTQLFTTFNFASNSQIQTAVQEFSRGYYNCTDVTSHLRVIVGTSNDGSDVTFNHGAAWAQMVNSVNNWIISNEIAQVIVLGGSDMEVGFNPPFATRSWVDGYGSTFIYSLINFGDAQGCPFERTYGVNGTCDNDWTQEDIWYISWGAPPSSPFPLIYATEGGNAAQWYSLSAYAHDAHQLAMYIRGSVTQYQACLQLPGQCPGIDNTPQEGWLQLSSALNSDPTTAQSLRWSTDFLWRALPVP